MICPDCSGMCDMNEIKLVYTLYDDKEVFFCPRCHKFSELKIIDEEFMEAEELVDFRNMREKLIKDALNVKEVSE